MSELSSKDRLFFAMVLSGAIQLEKIPVTKASTDYRDGEAYLTLSEEGAEARKAIESNFRVLNELYSTIEQIEGVKVDGELKRASWLFGDGVLR